MKNSFRNPDTQVLTGWGYADSNGSDLVRAEPEGFALEPGQWKLVNDNWVAHTQVIVPQVVTRFQARLALFQQGLLEAVEMAIAGADRPTQLAYEAGTFERHSPVVVGMAQALGLTDGQLDDLFILAATL